MIVNIPANVYWYDTGINVSKGDRLELTATGQWNSGLGLSSPDGLDESCGECPIVGEIIGNLVGKIGEGTPFPVGSSTVIVATQDGKLFLTMNENLGGCFDSRPLSCFEDNTGFLEVTVTVWHQ
jgi:hypothetical protein